MNKIVVGWSAFLGLLGVVSALLPVPGPWVAPFLLVPAWALLVFRGVPKGPAAVPVFEIHPAPPPPAVEPRVEVREVLPGGLAEEIFRYRASLEVLQGLKALVVSDTEGAVLQLTEALFTLVNNSKNVSAHIEKSLAFITDGDSGLGKTMGNLAEQVRVFETLSTHFTHLKDGLSGDIGSLTKAVGSINQFSETLSDLADQTNVLAINASIEAARVGIHGRGFAVIANQVQNLAKNSKEISEKMASTVREVVSNVETSFGRQTQRIKESEGLIVRSEKELRKWSDHVGPQLAEVGTMIGESRSLAGLVTNELNEVTVSLQFQDRTRQILDHMADVLAETSHKVVQSAGLDRSTVPGHLRDEAQRSASRHFTVREEWGLAPAAQRDAGAQRSTAVELF